MRTLLLQHASAPGQIRVWAGVIGVQPPLNLDLTTQGSPIAGLQLLSRQNPPGLDRTVTTALFEFPWTPGTEVNVELAVNGQQVNQQRMSSPQRFGPGQRRHILVASCFYKPAVDDGALIRAQAAIRKHCGGKAPDLCILCGDQVYLDLPLLENFPDRLDWMRSRFLESYIGNWFDGGGFSELLQSAPLLTLADDHELWNNAPEAQIHIGNTRSRDGRARWRTAALEAYQAFQKPPTNPPPAVPDVSGFQILDLGGLHLIALDLRWLREARSDQPAGSAMAARLSSDPRIFDALRRALADAQTAKAQAVVVTGQGLFRKPTRSKTDYEQADFADFGALCNAFSTADQRVIYLTGDVHFGRVCWAQQRQATTPTAGVYEAFVSPLALVYGSFLDHRLPSLKFWDSWPRHSPAELKNYGPFAKLNSALSYAEPEALEARTRDGTPGGGSKIGPAALEGDQLAVLTIDHQSAEVSASMTYFSLNSKPNAGMTVRLFPH